MRILVCLMFLVVSCSSTEKLFFYKVSKKNPIQIPEITYHVDNVHQVFYGRTVTLNYKRLPRLFQVARSQSAHITIKNIASKPYSFGPLFVPFFPMFWADWEKLNVEENLAIEFSASSNEVFDQKIVSIPDLEIILPDQRVLRPQSTVLVGGTIKRFTYAERVKDVPYFWVKETKIQTDKEPLIVPRLKFQLTSEFNYECCIQIGP